LISERWTNDAVSKVLWPVLITTVPMRTSPNVFKMMPLSETIRYYLNQVSFDKICGKSFNLKAFFKFLLNCLAFVFKTISDF